MSLAHSFIIEYACNLQFCLIFYSELAKKSNLQMNINYFVTRLAYFMHYSYIYYFSGEQVLILTPEEENLLNSSPKSKLDNIDYISYSHTIEFVLFTVNDYEFNAATTYFQRPNAENGMGANSATSLEPNIVYEKQINVILEQKHLLINEN